LGKFYFTCSFDDGDVADFRVAELLLKYNLKGTFYIPQTCHLVSESLSDQHIRQLSNLVEIGGHTMSHQVLTNITYEKCRSEIFNCKTWLENTTGKPVYTFCPPTGRFNKRHISFQKEAGFTSMRTVEMLRYSLRTNKANEFVILPTTIQIYNHSPLSYLKNSLKRFKLDSGLELFKRYNSDWQVMGKNFIAHVNEGLLNKNKTLITIFTCGGIAGKSNNIHYGAAWKRFLKILVL
jgi:peptidoglycan-N-acetylglucosamine deacetylase